MEIVLDYAFITALVLAALHTMGPRIRSVFRRHTSRVRSFGGGVGLAYVFLQLFPELDVAHAWMGRQVHLVALVSFLFFYALEVRLFTRPVATATKESPRQVFWLHVAIMCFYSSMVMFTLPDAIAEQFLFSIAVGLTIGLHLVYKDYVLRDRLRHEYQETGRYVLATAPLLGWLAHEVIQPADVVTDMFVAVLAGLLIQSVFRNELPNPETAKLRWLLAGVLTFAGLTLLS